MDRTSTAVASRCFYDVIPSMLAGKTNDRTFEASVLPFILSYTACTTAAATSAGAVSLSTPLMSSCRVLKVDMAWALWPSTLDSLAPERPDSAR